VDAVLRFFPVLHVLAGAVMLFSPAFLMPLALSVFLGDGARDAFGIGFAATFVAGLATFLATRGVRRRELQPRDGFLLVTLAWTGTAAFSTIPLLLHLPGLSFTDAYFEAISGMTTTGATVLTGLDSLPPSVNLWRAQLEWMGGMGILVLAVAILPILGVGGSQIYKAEASGPFKDTKLTPRIADTAKALWIIYVGLTVACAVAYRLAGMTWIDAVIHAFATLSLGGFSSHDASFGYFESPLMDAIGVAFMLVAAVNFSTHFLAWHRRSARAYVADPEARWTIVVMLGSAAMLAAFLVAKGQYPDFLTALRFTAFNTVSAATSSGFASTDYAQWPVFAPVWILFLSCFSSSSGSTGGGVKMVRAVLLFKQALREFTRIIHPSAVVPVNLGERVIENNTIFAVLAFMLMYGVTVIASTLLLALTGADIVTAFSASIACVNNLGPGLGEVGPAGNFQGLSDFQKWVCSATMLLGRLELFTVLVLFTPAFWRK